jgi:hypothetical protein
MEHQLEQLEELLSLFDGQALREAQEAVEHQIAELTERLEVTRQALAQAQAQRRRLARARLLLEEAPAADHPPVQSVSPRPPVPPPPTPLPERRRGVDRRKSERRKPDQPAPGGYATGV